MEIAGVSPLKCVFLFAAFSAREFAFGKFEWFLLEVFVVSKGNPFSVGHRLRENMFRILLSLFTFL